MKILKIKIDSWIPDVFEDVLEGLRLCRTVPDIPSSSRPIQFYKDTYDIVKDCLSLFNDKIERNLKSGKMDRSALKKIQDMIHERFSSLKDYFHLSKIWESYGGLGKNNEAFMNAYARTYNAFSKLLKELHKL